MPKDGHPPSYQRFPRDLFASLDGETNDFRLRYAFALDRSWDAQCYGVGSPDEWLSWALLDDAPEMARASFLRALSRHTVTTPDGTLVQLRMAKDRCEQALRHSKNRENGALGTPARESRRTPGVPPGYPGGTPSDPLASASASAENLVNTLAQSATERAGGEAPQEAEPTPPPKAASRIRPKGDSPVMAEWLTGWPIFYADFPRHVAKKPGLRAWRKLCPSEIGECQPLFDRISRALARDIEQTWAERPLDKIPYPGTWLNAAPWED